MNAVESFVTRWLLIYGTGHLLRAAHAEVLTSADVSVRAEATLLLLTSAFVQQRR